MRSQRESPPIAVAMQWVAQITTIGFELVVPVAAGYWLDERWGTQPWLLVTGAVLGSAVAFTHLIQLARRLNKSADSTSGPKR